MVKNLKIRQATVADSKFLAKIEYEASLPPMNYCFWDRLLETTGTTSLDFIAAKLEADASNWGKVEDFTILELNSRPVAAAAGYTPYSDDYRPLCLQGLDLIGQRLGWSKKVTEVFRKNYELFFGEDRQPEYLQPQAPWIIETVAILPEARGKGLSKILLRELLRKGQAQQHSHAGIMVIEGNTIARSIYESLGFEPCVSFDAEYFQNRFPGLIKFRLDLQKNHDFSLTNNIEAVGA